MHQLTACFAEIDCGQTNIFRQAKEDEMLARDKERMLEYAGSLLALERGEKLPSSMHINCFLLAQALHGFARQCPKPDLADLRSAPACVWPRILEKSTKKYGPGSLSIERWKTVLSSSNHARKRRGNYNIVRRQARHAWP